MRTQTLLLAAAAPAAVAVGYVILTGYVVSRVKPVPIAVLPEIGAETHEDAEGPAPEPAPQHELLLV